MALNPETKNMLMGVSTATLCTALFKRGLRNQFIQDVRPLNASLPNMVGEAYTLRYIPAREDLNPITVFFDREHPQRKAVEECPPGAVMVVDSRKNARAASAGALLVSRVVVIPANIADEVAREAVEMTAFEHFVSEEVLKGRSILGLYPATDPKTKDDFAAWRAANGR